MQNIRYIASPYTGYFRAVRTGPAGPAAAGPIFSQSTRAKMPYTSFDGLFNCCPTAARLVGTSNDGCRLQDLVGAGGKHALSPEEHPRRRSVRFGNCELLTIDREYACHYGG